MSLASGRVPSVSRALAMVGWVDDAAERPADWRLVGPRGAFKEVMGTELQAVLLYARPQLSPELHSVASSL